MQMTFFKKAIEDMAAESLRCVAIAYRSYEKEKVPDNEEQLAHWSLPDDDLVLLAIVGIKVRIFFKNMPIIVIIYFF
jgi:Ca2+-transporting ATPase